MLLYKERVYFSMTPGIEDTVRFLLESVRITVRFSICQY